MGVDHLQDEPKLILAYPHKSTFNRIGFSSMVSFIFYCSVDTESSYEL